MSSNLIVEAAAAEFKQILEAFCDCRDLATLTPDSAEAMAEGLREALAAAGVAAFRGWLECFEEQADIVHVRDESYRFKEVREKRFLTIFGEMVLPRRCFQNKLDTQSYVPLDAGWGMERQFMAPEVREAVLFACAHVTPEETVKLLGKCALFSTTPTAIKHVVENTGKQVAEHRQALDEAIHAGETVPEGTRVMAVSIDGATLLMNQKGVHFGRPSERPGTQKPQQTPTAYRVAMVGAVTQYGAQKSPEQTPERLQSRYVAHMPERGSPNFKKLLEAELDVAEARLPKGTPRILLLDGARELWSYFDKNTRYDGYHRCIDFWHVAEHLSKAAEALFGTGKQAKRWYQKYYRILISSDDGAARIRRSIHYYAKTQTRNKTRAKHLQEEHTYFRRNGDRMRYATFRANGWPIGSGPIEAACKTLVKTRLCRSGMRWSQDGGRNILNLRTYVKSNRWVSAWKFLKQLDRAA